VRVSAFQYLQLITLFAHTSLYSPVFVLLHSLLEILVNSVEFVQRNLLFILVQLENSHFYDAFCVLESPISSLVLTFFVDRIQFTHFQQHVILFVDLILLDAFDKLSFTQLFFLLEFS